MHPTATESTHQPAHFSVGEVGFKALGGEVRYAMCMDICVGRSTYTPLASYWAAVSSWEKPARSPSLVLLQSWAGMREDQNRYLHIFRSGWACARRQKSFCTLR